MHVPVILDSMLYSVVWLCCADVHVVSCSECEQWDDMMMKTNEFCAEKDMHMLLSPTISFRMRYLSTYIRQFNERMTSSVPSTPLIKWLDAQIEISITFEWEYTRVKSSNKIRWFDTAIRYLFVFVFFTSSLHFLLLGLSMLNHIILFWTVSLIILILFHYQLLEWSSFFCSPFDLVYLGWGGGFLPAEENGESYEYFHTKEEKKGNVVFMISWDNLEYLISFKKSFDWT